MSIKALITSLALGSATLASLGAASAAPYRERVEMRHDRDGVRDRRIDRGRFERERFERHWWQPRAGYGRRWDGRR